MWRHPQRRTIPRKFGEFRRRLTLRVQKTTTASGHSQDCRAWSRVRPLGSVHRGEAGLFKPREHAEFGQGGPAAIAAALSYDQLLAEVDPPAPSLAQRLCRRRDAWAELNWAPDLAEDIGSAQWFRGLATMLGFSVFALSFWPDYSSVEAAPTLTLEAAQRDEFRSQMILPLALGADSGRHMGATSRVTPLADAPDRPMVQ